MSNLQNVVNALRAGLIGGGRGGQPKLTPPGPPPSPSTATPSVLNQVLLGNKSLMPQLQRGAGKGPTNG